MYIHPILKNNNKILIKTSKLNETIKIDKKRLIHF